MNWTGRELNSLNGNGLDVSYSYDTNGTRISKTVNGTKYEYQYESGKLFYENRDKAEFYYQYDGTGALSTIIHYDGNGNRAQYYVLCNSRGDIVDIYNQDGTLAAHYVYDSWGNTISILDINGNEITDSGNIGILNQIRYRGYYLDTETGYYYLMSRYYNPELGRFLNADCGVFLQDSILESNVYIYCVNNPIINSDCMGLYSESEQALLDKANASFKSKMGTQLNGYTLVEIDPDFDRKYEIVTISYIYQKNNDEFAYKSAVYFYGKVGDIREMADAMYDMHELNFERQVAFIQLVGEFMANLIVAEIYLLVICLVVILNYNWINQSAEYKSWVAGLPVDDYAGHIQSLMEWRAFD